MKMFKRFAAALLAGVMVLAMLTACGGNGGGGAPVAHVTRDEALEKSVAEWTVEWGKSKNLELTVDDSLTAMSDKCLPTAVNAENARLTSPIDPNAHFDAVNKREKVFATAKNGKKAALVPVTFTSEIEVTKDTLAYAYAALRTDVQSNLEQAGVMNPTKFGVTVTKQKEYTLVLFVVSE